MLPPASSLSAPFPLGFQARVGRGQRPISPRCRPGPRPGAARPQTPLQRVDGDPAGEGADPQAEGDADTVAGEAVVQVVPVPERGRGAGRLPHGCLGSAWPGARASAWPGTRAQPPPAARRTGRCLPARLLLRFCSFAAAPAERADRRPEMGAPRSALQGAGGGGQDSREKFPGTRGSPPLALLSGVGGREAAPQWRKPGAASAQRLRPTPPRQRQHGSRGPLRCHAPPNPAARAEYSDLPAHCEAPRPFINPPCFLSQTIHTWLLGSLLGRWGSRDEWGLVQIVKMAQYKGCCGRPRRRNQTRPSASSLTLF